MRPAEFSRNEPRVEWFCPIHGWLDEREISKHASGEWAMHGYCSAPVTPRVRASASAPEEQR